MKRALLASMVLVAGVLAGCGGSDDDGDSSAGATTADFCGSFEDMVAEFEQLEADAKPAAAVRILKDAGTHLADVGTPSDMSDDARAGFEFVLDEIEQLDGDATRQEIDRLGAGATDRQRKGMGAYQAYLNRTCAEQLGAGSPGDAP